MALPVRERSHQRARCSRIAGVAAPNDPRDCRQLAAAPAANLTSQQCADDCAGGNANTGGQLRFLRWLRNGRGRLDPGRWRWRLRERRRGGSSDRPCRGGGVARTVPMER